MSRESRAGSKPEASPPAHSYSRASHLYPPTTIHRPANILNILDFFLISLNFFRICWKSKASIANCLSPTPCQHHLTSCKHQSVNSTAHSSNLLDFAFGRSHFSSQATASKSAKPKGHNLYSPELPNPPSHSGVGHQILQPNCQDISHLTLAMAKSATLAT